MRLGHGDTVIIRTVAVPQIGPPGEAGDRGPRGIDGPAGHAGEPGEDALPQSQNITLYRSLSEYSIIPYPQVVPLTTVINDTLGMSVVSGMMTVRDEGLYVVTLRVDIDLSVMTANAKLYAYIAAGSEVSDTVEISADGVDGQWAITWGGYLEVSETISVVMSCDEFTWPVLTDASIYLHATKIGDGVAGSTGATGPAGVAGPRGPAGPAGTGAIPEDWRFQDI